MVQEEAGVVDHGHGESPPGRGAPGDVQLHGGVPAVFQVAREDVPRPGGPPTLPGNVAIVLARHRGEGARGDAEFDHRPPPAIRAAAPRVQPALRRAATGEGHADTGSGAGIGHVFDRMCGVGGLGRSNLWPRIVTDIRMVMIVYRLPPVQVED